MTGRWRYGRGLRDRQEPPRGMWRSTRFAGSQRPPCGLPGDAHRFTGRGALCVPFVHLCVDPPRTSLLLRRNSHHDACLRQDTVQSGHRPSSSAGNRRRYVHGLGGKPRVRGSGERECGVLGKQCFAPSLWVDALLRRPWLDGRLRILHPSPRAQGLRFCRARRVGVEMRSRRDLPFCQSD